MMSAVHMLDCIAVFADRVYHTGVLWQDDI